MRTSFIAWRLGLPSFILPFMFVYGPALLMMGSAGDILVALATSMAGISILAMCLQGYGYLIGHLGLLQRGLLLAAAVCLIKPGLLTDGLGVALAAIVWIGAHLKRKASRKRLDPGSC